MAGNETLLPSTTPQGVTARPARFDPAEVGTTDEDLLEFLVNRLLFGEYTETLNLPETATAEDLRDFLLVNWTFKIEANTGLAARLNGMAPLVVKEYYNEVFNGLKWRSKVVSEPEAGDGRHYQAAPASNGRGAIGTAADPVNLFNGVFSYGDVDLQLDGAGCKFSFERAYRQLSGYNGPLGHNWDHSYNIWLRAALDGSYVAVSDGGLQPRHFRRHEVHDYFAPPDGAFEIVLEVAGGFMMRSPDGAVVEFAPHGFLEDVFVAARIVDRFGNYQNLSYADGLLRQVEVNLPGRNVSFAYDEVDRIIAVADFTGRTWRYDYDDFGDLVAVTSPATPEWKQGLSTLYEYSSAGHPSQPHNLTTVVDPRGGIILENAFGTEPSLLSYNRVVCQREGAGETVFEYSDVVEDYEIAYRSYERPAFETLVTERDGRQVRHLFNALGNTILRQEYARLDGLLKIVTTQYRYNKDGNLIGILSPSGVLTQYYFGRDAYERRLVSDEAYRAVADPDLSPQVRQGFGNLLATAKRGRYLDVQLAGMSAGLWSADLFPNIFDTAPDDVVTKFTYDPAYNQLLTSSDPRFTTSADPDVIEPPGYAAHLTRYAYAGPLFTLQSVTLPAPTLPDGTRLGAIVTTFEAYDAQGRLLRTHGPDGLVIVNEYHPLADGIRCGFLKKIVVDPGGLEIATGVERDELGRVVRVYRPQYFDTLDGRYASSLRYNDLDQVIENRSTAPFDVREQYRYDGAGNLKCATTDLKDDDNALVGQFDLRNRYDEESHLLWQEAGDRANGQTKLSRVAFDGAGRPLVEIQPSGRRSKCGYGERSLKNKVIDDFGGSNATTKLAYDADGRLVKQVDPLGPAATFQYDALGRMVERCDPLGHRSIFHYDKAGNLLARLEYEALPNGDFRLMLREAFDYDELNRRAAEHVNRFESGPIVAVAQLRTAFASQGPGDLLTTQYFHDQGGKLFKVVDRGGQVHELAHDLPGRLVATVDPLGNVERFIYDKENHLVRHERVELVRDVLGAVVGEQHFAESLDYDELNRVISRTDTLGSTFFYRYDSRSNLVQTSGPLASHSRNEYDVFSRLVARCDTLHAQAPAPPQILETRYRHSRADLVDQIVDPLGRITRFSYDTVGRRTSVILPDGSADETVYDRAGNVLSYADRNGVRKTFSYDAVHRNTGFTVDATKIDPQVTLGGAKSYRTEFDALGRTWAVENDVARIELTYNSVDDVVAENVLFKTPAAPGGAAGLSTRRAFDLSGLPAAIIYPSGRTLELDRDALGRVVSLRQSLKGDDYPGDGATADAYAVAETRFEGLRVKSIERSNGATTTYRYDRGGRIVGMDHGQGQAALLEMQWLYDANGNMRRSAERSPSHQAILFHGFDSLFRLTQTRAATTPGLIDLEPLGPATSPIPTPIPSSQLEIDPLLEDPASSPSAQYTYDAMGNRLASTIAGTTVDYHPNPLDQYEGASFRYDRNGNLVADANGTYTYDHANQLVGVQNASTGEVFGFACDPLGRRCMASGPAGDAFMIYDGERLIEEYHGADLHSSWVADPNQPGVLAAARDQHEVVYLCDMAGSTRCLMSDGQASEVIRYDDFGNIVNGAPVEDGEFLYAGKRFLAPAAKYDFYFRAYDPKLGRFLQRDPAGYADGLNLYAYVGNNPLTFTDRFGTERQPLLLGKDLGADLLGEPLDFNDPNLGMDSISKFYFREDGMLLRWNANTESWIEDYTGALFIESQAPQPKASRLERYMRGVKGAVLAPIHLAKDTTAKVVDITTQGFAVLGKVTGGWDVGYTTWSSTSKAVEAGVSQSALIWQATGGLVVDPIVAFGDQMVGLASGQMDIWEFGGQLVGDVLKSTFLPAVGSYSKVKGHHVHQSASYRTLLGKNPNHEAAVAMQQGVRGFTKKDHANASRAQRNINRAAWNKTIKRPNIGPVTISATGTVGKNFKPTPSQWFEDVKAYYSLVAAGVDRGGAGLPTAARPNIALELVQRSRAQIESVGVQPVRVPHM